MEKRPALNKNISVEDFKDFYWLKAELVAFCKASGLPTSGSKIAVANRIVHYLQTGEIEKVGTTRPKKTSTFNWKSDPLSLTTLITDNYQNTEAVRQFFIKEIGKPFKFNVVFMNWMKDNVGKTLSDAIEAWNRIKEADKQRNQPKEIAPQFEYNTYLRDFLADNPTRSRAEGIQLWKIKRSQRGDNVYKKADLAWL